MSRANSLIGILVSLVIGGLILQAGSQGSIQVYGLPLFVICGAIGFVLHWSIFLPSFAFQTEHYFDLTGSHVLCQYRHRRCSASIPSWILRDLIIGAMILVWALRLGSFLFWRIKKDGQDKRFVLMKTKFSWFLNDLDPRRALGSGHHGCRPRRHDLQYHRGPRPTGLRWA